LAAQALGLAHGVAHGLVPAHVSHEAAADGHAHAGHEADDAAGHEAGSADCRLIDQLSHAAALCGGASLPPTLPRAAAIGTAADVPALPRGSAAAYLARGPPASA